MKMMPILMVGAALLSCSDSVPPAHIEPSVVTFEGANARSQDAKIAHGERLATLLACTSCHNADLTGGDYGEDAEGGFIFAPNLTRAVPRLSDWQLRRLMSEGVHPSRERFYYMPAKTLQRLSKKDTDALIAFLRSLEPKGDDWPMPQEGETTLALVEMGILETSADGVQAYRMNGPPDVEGSLALGRYVAGVTCAECHGPSLDGELGSAPSLQAALGRIDEAQLRSLLQGHGSGGLMKLVASRNLSVLTVGERDALVGYLLSLGAAD